MGGLSALPGVILILAATIVLALCSFNVPSIKSLYFFKATFSSGDYAGELKLGTLGYCLTQSGKENCVGPQVGYSLELNTILGIGENLFKIPAAVSKWMSYTLILHVVALGFCGLGALAGLLDLIPGFQMICFPTCLAGIGGAVALIALIFDLIMFFIFKASVNKITGAHGEIGMCVWMTLAAWLLASFAGCAYGLGRCCCNCGGGGGGGGRRDRKDRKRDRERDRELDDYRRDEDLRLDALRDEQKRQKEQGLPNFPEYERMPLTQNEDKYLYSEAGDAVPSVGVGYGRRDPAPHHQEYYDNYHDPYAPQAGYEPTITDPGAAGVGAGPSGIVATQQPVYDPYAAPGVHNDPYAQYPPQNNESYDPYARNTAYNEFATYPPQATSPQMAAAVPVAAYYGEQQYPNHGPQVHQQPYQSFDHDDGLGGIGRAATSPTMEQQYRSAAPDAYKPTSPLQPLQPRPQHLRSTDLLTEASGMATGGTPSEYSDTESNRPPSYNIATSDLNPQTSQVSGYRPEKGRPV